METLSEMSDLVIVSAYGRGHWLALECARRGWKVSLLELTPGGLENSRPEDWEGPWGFFDSPDLLPSQRDHLLATSDVDSVAGGYTIWMQRGPLELGGPLADFQSRSFGIPDDVQSYLSEQANSDTPTIEENAAKTDRPVWISRLTLKGLRTPDAMKGRSGLRSRLRNLAFDKNWLGNLAHTVSSTVLLENTDATEFGAPLSLRAPYFVRHYSLASAVASLDALKAAGVKVQKLDDLYDVRVQSGHFDSIVLNENGETENGRAFTWMLTSRETARFHRRIMNSLFPAGAVVPNYFWSKFRFEISDATSSRSLPLAFTIIESVFLPWTHCNLLKVKRVPSDGSKRGGSGDEKISLGVWMRLPLRALGDKTYFESMRDECAAILKKRIPRSEPVAHGLPFEAGREANDIQSLRFPIADRENFDRLKITSAQNLFYSNPEEAEAYDLNAQLRHQTAVFAALERLKAHWENVERKARAEAQK